MPSFDLDPFLTSVVLFSIFIAILLLIVSFTNRNPSRKGKQKPKVNSHGVPQVSAEAYREHMETLRSDGYSSQNVSGNKRNLGPNNASPKNTGPNSAPPKNTGPNNAAPNNSGVTSYSPATSSFNNSSSNNSGSNSTSSGPDILTTMLLMDAMSNHGNHGSVVGNREPSEPAPAPEVTTGSNVAPESWSSIKEAKSPVENWSGIPDEPVSARNWSSIDSSAETRSRASDDRGWSSVSNNDSPSWSASPAPAPAPSDSGNSCSSSSCSSCGGGD